MGWTGLPEDPCCPAFLWASGASLGRMQFLDETIPSPLSFASPVPLSPVIAIAKTWKKFKNVIKTWSNCWACTCFLKTEETAAGAALLPVWPLPTCLVAVRCHRVCAFSCVILFLCISAAPSSVVSELLAKCLAFLSSAESKETDFRVLYCFLFYGK